MSIYNGVGAQFAQNIFLLVLGSFKTNYEVSLRQTFLIWPNPSVQTIRP